MEATHKIEPEGRADARERSSNRVSLLFTWAEHIHALSLCEGQEVVVGRAEPAELILTDHSLSRTHARLSLLDGRVTLEDLGSTNGCLLNGVRLAVITVGVGDVVQLGAVELRVCAHVSSLQSTDEVSHGYFMRLLADELARARVFDRAVSVLALRDPPPPVRQFLRTALRPVDRLCSFAPSLNLVLLPERDRAAALTWLQNVCWPAENVRQVGIASFPDLTCTAEELVSHALDACYAPTSERARRDMRAASSAIAPPLRSPALVRLYDLAARAARTTLPVLVLGETGSGKELVARELHERSPRSRGPFKALNCATIPAGLLESVLFGHERGAFTGAARQSEGVFEQARGGTVFLDEVGELSGHAQAALLRVLEQRRIVRVGGTKEIEVDARVVAATHRDLAAMVQAGTFRQDLLFRLDALTLTVPPLRDRPEEIVPLAELFLARAKAEWAANAARLSEGACEALLAYAWPGNVRQLKNVIERAVVVCTGELIDVQHLPAQVWAHGGQDGPPAPLPTATSAGARSLPDRVREFEVEIIREALVRAHGNQARAARALGVPRRTLTNKIHAYGLV